MHDWKSLVRARLGALPVDGARASDIVDELAQHVSEHYKDLVSSGVDDEAALTIALAPLADRAAVEIAQADRPRPVAPEPPAGRAGLFIDLGRDIRYAARVLRRTPAFTIVAVATLALGIAANTAIFSVVNAVLLRPLPYADADRLVTLGARGADGSTSNVGYTTFLDWRERTHSFEQMALIRMWTPTLAANDVPERIAGMRVSANFFQMLGIRPALGRDFAAEEDALDRWRVVMLSDGLWRRRFGADPAAIGRVITMNDQQYTIVGVLPPSFEALISERYYQRAEMWAPLGYERSQPYACRDCQHLKAIGRLAGGTSIDAARADLEAVHSAMRREFPAVYPTETMAVVPLRDVLTGEIRPALAVLTGAVACVLLIACANVANLMLSRMASREHDLALRAALGAARGRLVRQLMVESALIALSAAVIGVLLCVVAVPALTQLAPASMARLVNARLDGGVLGFSLLLSVVTACAFGLVPALRGSRIDPYAALQTDGRKSAAAPASLARRLLVAANVAIAVVLLAGAGLMIKSVSRLLGVHPGFDPRGVLTLQMSMVGKAYATNEAVVRKHDEIIARVHALPGVETAALAGQIPLGGNGDRWGFHIEGRPPGPEDPSVERFSVTPEYFDVMRIPLRRGRLFTNADRATTENVMLIGEQTARTLWPNADPIGQRVRIGGNDGPWRTIVGIVGDVRHQELAAAPTLQMYMPQAQLPDSFLTLVMRSSVDPASLTPLARKAIWSVAGDVPIYQVATLEDLVAKSVAPRRFIMILLEIFGGLALLLTAIGVYGVISYSVTERTREIGIRAALGATPRNIVRLILGSGLTTVNAGLAVGLVAALGATRYLESSLFEVHAHDPATFVTIALVLFAVAVGAQIVPIARALRVEPNVALRQE